MPIRKIRQSWFIDFRFGGERCRKRSPLNTPEGALAYEMFLKKECGLYGSVTAALRANVPENVAPCPTLAEFSPRWFKGYVAVNNRPMEQQHKSSAFEYHLLPYFGKMRLSDIGSEEIEGYKGNKRTMGLSAKSINNQLAILHRCLVSAKEWGVLRTDVPKVPLLRSVQPTFRFLTEVESDRLLAAAPEGVYRTMVLMGLRTGMRFCELAGVQWGDVDLERRLVAVCRSVVAGYMSPPKNNRVRYVPLTAEVVCALSALDRGGDQVFPRDDGRLMDYNDAWRAIAQASRDAGIEHVSWHDLRHTFASRLVERGASLLSVQKLLGHSDIQVTMRYSHLGKDALRDTIALLDRPVQLV